MTYLAHRLFLIALTLLSCLSAFTARPVFAESGNMDMGYFISIPVLQDGRIKPLDTFARSKLARFSGKDHLHEMDADEWLAMTLFDPANAAGIRVFRIDNENLRHLLGLEERKKPLYAYGELVSGLEKTFPTVENLMKEPPRELTADQKALLALHENALEYTQILRSFSLLLPLDVSLPDKWSKKLGLSRGAAVNYMALKKIDTDLQQTIKSIIRKKGENPEKYSAQEQQAALLGWQIRTIEDAAQGNNVLRVIPDLWSGEDDAYVAPWQLVLSGKGGPETADLLKSWQNLAASWQDQDNAAWNEAARKLSGDTPPSIRQELKYNRIQPFRTGTILFALAFATCLFLISLPDHGKIAIKVVLAFLTSAMLLIALLLEGSGLLARIFILGRPPVGTLYESILFVGWIAPLFALLAERKLKNNAGILIAGLSGTLIGLLGLSMADEGDNMKVLTAVLNTQFWLTVHVLCITIGYGWCLVVSALAHIILWQDTRGKAEKSLYDTQKTLALTALLFTAVGTILGGIWADQSWGRFWGWDPKENGALLIVLWLVWLIHGRIAGQLSEKLVTMGLAFLSVIVGIAWIGVNLLGVGLHSYGFIEGLFWGLGAFALLEIALIGSLAWKGKTS